MIHGHGSKIRRDLMASGFYGRPWATRYHSATGTHYRHDARPPAVGAAFPVVTGLDVAVACHA